MTHFASKLARVIINRRHALTGGLSALGVTSLITSPVSAKPKKPPKSDQALNHARWDKTTLTLSNGVNLRTLRLPTPDRPYITTTDYRPLIEASKYFSGHNPKSAQIGGKVITGLESDEFSFLVDGKSYNAASGWRVTAIKTATDAHQGHGAEVTLLSVDGRIEVGLRYLMYPASPVVRKRLTLKNLGSSDVKIENIIVEQFNLEDYWPGTFSWVYGDYGRRKSVGPFVGERQDALVALHNPDWGQGIVLGNEAAGVNKYTSAFVGSANFRAGLAPKDSHLPYRRWLKAGQVFTAPQVFSIVYTSTPRFETILNTAVPDFVRKNMGIKLSQYPRKPTFVYNTWEPFQFAIDEKLIMELATAAAAAGAKTFVIDDGWQDIYGDWNVDKVKFPNGLRPVFDYIKALGMKPGLWISIGSAHKNSKVYQAHPEWFVRDEHGKPYSVHHEGDTERLTACMSTGWRGYMGGLLKDLIREHGLEYLKLDFAVVTSPYQFNTTRAGCYAPNHAGHKDHVESLSVNYDYLWQVFDEFKAHHPEVFIDCTFETMGGVQMIDYAMLQHAEGNWLSNFNEPDQINDLRIRNMAWWRSPAMPATALVIGNSKLADTGFELHLKSLAGCLPIVLGDPRLMKPNELARCRRYSDFFQEMQARHDVFSFRQDLKGFGEPAEGAWDGFQRINTETRSGGLIGVFRHGAAESKRHVTVSYLSPNETYSLRDMKGAEIIRQTGYGFETEGFELTLSALYDGDIYEIIRVRS